MTRSPQSPFGLYAIDTLPLNPARAAADLAGCEERDTKGLYAKARAGEIKEFTGISSPYDEAICRLQPVIMRLGLIRVLNKNQISHERYIHYHLDQ